MDRAVLQYARRRVVNAGRQASSRRRQVTLLYLAAIRRDFEQSLRVARIVAVLSPEYQVRTIRKAAALCGFPHALLRDKARLASGHCAQPQVLRFGQMVTSLAMPNGRGDGSPGRASGTCGGNWPFNRNGNNARVRFRVACGKKISSYFEVVPTTGPSIHSFEIHGFAARPCKEVLS